MIEVRPMRYAYATIPVLLVGAWLFACQPATDTTAAEEEWISLFNGQDLSGWETFLGVQPGSEDTTILGVNNDPKGVFSVVDGQIRITGEIWGALTTLDEFENYHLRMEVRWGDIRFPPREDLPRDSGLLYHAVGPHGVVYGSWMTSHELQILEGDFGDYHSLAGPMIDLEAQVETRGENEVFVYEEGAEQQTGVAQRVVKSSDQEKPHGEWNTIELIAEGGNIMHIVNGIVVLRASNSRRVVDGVEVPLTRGKIQIQSEAAEVFLRNIEIRQL
jgi:hypothetical protein